jgi:hypothetical protein
MKSHGRLILHHFGSGEWDGEQHKEIGDFSVVVFGGGGVDLRMGLRSRMGNEEHGNRSLGQAGRNRWLGRRPRVRGVAMNPVYHPMGGGEGHTPGGGHSVSPWGQLAKGKPARRQMKTSHSMILVRRNGKKMRKESGKV